MGKITLKTATVEGKYRDIGDGLMTLTFIVPFERWIMIAIGTSSNPIRGTDIRNEYNGYDYIRVKSCMIVAENNNLYIGLQNTREKLRSLFRKHEIFGQISNTMLQSVLEVSDYLISEDKTITLVYDRGVYSFNYYHPVDNPIGQIERVILTFMEVR